MPGSIPQYTCDDLKRLKEALFRHELTDVLMGDNYYHFRDRQELIYTIGLIYLYLEMKGLLK